MWQAQPSKTSLIAPGAENKLDRPQSGALSTNSKGSVMKMTKEDLKREREEALSNMSKKRKSQDLPTYREGYEVEIKRLVQQSFKQKLYEAMEEINYGVTIEKVTGHYHPPKWYNEDEEDKNVPM